MRELVDECKTFFFGGFETTSLSITWTLLLLALNEDWQNQLRDEIKEVVGNIEELDINLLADLKKMKWVMNKVIRLYPPSPNVPREVKEDIQEDIWIDANNFKPQRFMNDANGGWNHTMGYLPFGFGGRTSVGCLSYLCMKYGDSYLLEWFKPL
ncbi:cytokinin hydroxylase-like [Cicer arietinum]|uniref:cytokinin hydroxylase-like n=1 Tax=Cicer arietinum TaxID=3827 RepID=UPI00032AAE31